ncbi:autophagy-related protein 13 homolog isoform X2 [Nilaparvata lugens]|uniref:autophagy-related protein 13 homolog isoform X2 n=1 Tax=Nilaparvata lugens TaxID=108931 RepID=UPI000B990E7F|nr:autophagy-related protein 13 homolog isoform X2 [Nilaparvata lugens]XP_039286135.1 autophagy-related protein 13 homolog isoform X2 [Nilaparvata lugens]XP_039286136.1 autophagy-related protein 13 homolog isoform X2 [Nilaparvata lugens]
MSTMKLSLQEKKDLEKFMKFFTLKSAQIIVQSRLGEKVNTKCDPDSSGTVWFNLAIRDLPDVLAEAKKAMWSGSCRLPVCVEISLRTVEGDTMILETWCIAVTADHDPSIPVSYAIYNRMGILLKSLLSVTRITPAYRISRRQGPDSYVICYRIYLGEPQHHTLGDGYKQVRVGQLSTPIGALSLSVAYRTKLTISPQHSGNKDNSIMLKSDHFRPERDFSPKHFRNDDNNTTSTLSDTIKFGAFADNTSMCCRTVPSATDDSAAPDLIVPEVPFTTLLTPKTAPSPPPPPVTATSTEDSDNGNTTTAPTTAPPPAATTLSHTNDSADFIMKTPFAGSNANTDLGVFYRECQSAPPLQGFQEEPTVAEQVGDLTKQLELFETSLQEYDNVITSLCKSDNNN